MEHKYYMLNKPPGMTVSSRDARGGRIPAETLIREKLGEDLVPVGRLDKDTEGIVLFTNDRELAGRLGSPQSGIERTYFAELDGVLSEVDIERISGGTDIGDGRPTLPALVVKLSDTSVFVTLYESRYREVRRLLKTAGLRALTLRRISVASVALDTTLAPGEFRELTPKEVGKLSEI